MIKSPLRYPGGKSRAVEFLKSHISDFIEFREIFFGGGSLSIFYNQIYPNKKYYASDLNYELYCFWHQLQNNTTNLIESIQKLYNDYKPNSGKELYNFLLNRRETKLTELERGIDFFILNRITFSGIVDSGGYSNSSFNDRFTQSSIDRLNTVIEAIKNINFCCEDYSYLINEKGNDVFLYLDPPYYSATKSKLYGKKGILHTQFDHNLLYNNLINCEHRWLITYDNSEYIKNLYKDFYQKEWNLQYGSAKIGNELLISNYKI